MALIFSLYILSELVKDNNAMKYSDDVEWKNILSEKEFNKNAILTLCCFSLKNKIINIYYISIISKVFISYTTV